MNTNGTEIHGRSNEGEAHGRAERHYAFARGLDWASIVDTSDAGHTSTPRQNATRSLTWWASSDGVG